MAGDWWRDAVIYQVYVRSFADGNGDGIGDLPGIRSRLPYLAGLGVDALWITPFYTSPMADGGYDVADYRDVDPTLGTLDDARGLVRAAHEQGLKVIVDIVPNHTSSRHEWFRQALQSAPGSPERDRYLFREGTGDAPPNDWESVFGGGAWTRLPDGQWYLHLFDPTQPDLNWANPQVRDEFHDVLRFWLDLGVDGFRIDVAHGMVKQDGFPDVGAQEQHKLLETRPLPYFDQDGVHEIYREWRKVLDTYDPPRIGVAEAWTATAERLARYLRPDELHQAFNFHYLTTGWEARALREVVDHSLTAIPAVGAPATWVLSNHDVHRHATRYGGGPAGVRRARAAILLMLALPGSVYLYQGEELGLEEVLDLPEEVLQDPMWERSGHTDRGRDGCRVPIPWTRGGSALGFGADGSTPWLPQPEAWSELSVEAQTGVEGSTLELYRGALHTRREHPALGAGDAVDWQDSEPEVLWFSRTAAGRTLHCAVNLGPEPARLPAGTVLLASDEYEVDGSDTLLPTDTSVWWEA
ncbi:glycoside hydrolase family 13 protein [Actinokineospora spheciospongiae]|uniref:glycoside hydrolase family 13 protein n=1 Tax=Actinokineospora spheciospongiae TaxID=909613 RepID=UPI000D709F45|nr:glycoside hydrolase family 13 protein [Actinokineospora spheciospongiae]PWW54883.1 alpha-glucosidase [Actinokineospora spheciospongiae]